MKLEDIIAKLEQIEQQANLTLNEFPRGPTIERQRLIAAIARQVRTHLRDQLRHGDRDPLSAGRHLHSVAKEDTPPQAGSAR